MKHIYIIFLAIGSMLFPVLAIAATEALKTPLQYSLRDYGFVLAVSVSGGIISWINRVRKGKIEMSITALIGEVVTSAFCGLLTFWVCEALAVHPLITAASAGMAGHMGSETLSWIEAKGKKWVEKRFGVEDSAVAPLDKQ